MVTRESIPRINPAMQGKHKDALEGSSFAGEEKRHSLVNADRALVIVCGLPTVLMDCPPVRGESVSSSRVGGCAGLRRRTDTILY